MAAGSIERIMPGFSVEAKDQLKSACIPTIPALQYGHASKHRLVNMHTPNANTHANLFPPLENLY